MPILHITGPAKSGKSLMANNLRNNHINQGNGALLVDDSQTGEPRYLLEKLMLGESLGEPGMGPPVPRPASKITWKADPLVIVVGDKIAIMDEFEKLAPGFKKMLGPVKKMAMSV